LLFDADTPVMREVGRALAARGRVVRVTTSHAFERVGADEFRIDPSRPEHYVRLFDTLGAAKQLPRQIVHGWALASAASFDAAQEVTSVSLLFLARALLRHTSESVDLTMLSPATQLVNGLEASTSDAGTIVGATKTVAQECPHRGSRRSLGGDRS
jgi:hypothetical protein